MTQSFEVDELQFKPGDRVKVVDDGLYNKEWSDVRPGAIGTVQAIGSSDIAPYCILFDGQPAALSWPNRWLELVTGLDVILEKA